MVKVGGFSGSGNSEGKYVWKKLTAEGGDFIDFVVSDSETDYPDGGTQGGYWYEKSGGGILDKGALNMGYTKFEYGTITITSNSSYFQINHGMKIKPKFVFLKAKNPANSTIKEAIYSECATKILYDYNTDFGYGQDVGGKGEVTETSIRFNLAGSMGFGSGSFDYIMLG